jgi:hypothetical protein
MNRTDERLHSIAAKIGGTETPPEPPLAFAKSKRCECCGLLGGNFQGHFLGHLWVKMRS